MANHQLRFFTLNDQHTSNNNPMNQITQSNTNLRPMPNPNPNPNPNPPRGRRSGGRPQRVRDRPAQRGPSIAELERQIVQPTIPPSNIRPVSDIRVNPLPGVPVIGYSQPVSDPRLITNRVGIPQSELPSMPNIPLQQPPPLSLKKIRMSDEEVGFAGGSNGHFAGIHMNIGDNHNNPLPNIGGSEVLAIHPRRSNGSNIMMEYGFFPRKSEEIMELKSHEKYNPDMIEEQEQEQEHEQYLKLKMGFTDSSSPSSSSSLSSLTTNNSSNDSSIDLSLKL